ncbi:MAG: ATP-grasp domain-containing protein, partial [Dethiobacteria bacterium]
MKLYEYMGKELFSRYGIPVPQGKVCSAPAEVAEAVKEIGSSVIKSQVLTGKRGKAGGISFTDNPQEAETEAKRLLGMEIGDYKVEKLLVESKLQIDKELYLAITVDGAARCPIVLASAEGGMDIEEVPDELMVRRQIDISIGVQPYLAMEITYR